MTNISSEILYTGRILPIAFSETDLRMFQVQQFKTPPSQVIESTLIGITSQFKNHKISKDEISNHPDKYVIIVIPSMRTYLQRISGIDGGNLIYSIWQGYIKKPDTKKFIEYFESRGFSTHNIHTSGHADLDTLKQMVEAIDPKTIVRDTLLMQVITVKSSNTIFLY